MSTVRAGFAGAFCNGVLHPIGVDGLRAQGHARLTVSALASRYPDIQGVVQEGTGHGSLSAVAEWKTRGIMTVLVPANIEALAPNHHSWTHRGLDVAQRFAHERRWLAMADAIFTISLEEAWWLELHGIAAQILPYYPHSAHLRTLEQIRHRRQPDPECGLLWLADFRNPANWVGASTTLRWLEEHVPANIPVQVVGRGIESVRDRLAATHRSQLQILGEISAAQLESLQSRCLAQLIVHPATSGMLTRVVDAAVAGIPIVGNDMALKSYRHFFAGTEPQPEGPLAARVLSAPRRPDEEAFAFLSCLLEAGARP